MSSERANAIKELWDKGVSPAQIARTLGVAHTTVTYWAYYFFKLPRRSKRLYETAWTKIDDAKLKELWVQENKSCKAIGAELKKTKGAIIGRAHRLGLANKRHRTKREAKLRGPRKPAVRRIRSRVPLPPIEGLIVPMPVLGGNVGVHIVDLEARHCRYITHMGEDGLARYCGATKPYLVRNQQPFYIGSWCAEHAAICYQIR